MTRTRPSGLWLLCTAHFMSVLDLTVVNGVLGPLGRDLGASTGMLTWVIGAYAVAFGGFLLAGGRVADILGPRRTFVLGSLGFALASLACAAAPGVVPLVAARAAQGLAAAFLEPSAVALLACLYPAGPRRLRALAVWGSAGSLGAVSGMLVGGAIAQFLDWRVVFLLNVPVGLLGAVLAPRLFPAGARDAGGRVDLLGAAALTGGCSGLLVLVGSLEGGLSRAAPVGAVVAVLGLGGFALRHGRTSAPLVPHGFLRRSGVGLPAATGAVQGALMLGSLLLLAIALVEVMGLGPIEAGAAMLAMRATQASWARVAGRLIARLGPGPAHLVGLAGMSLACLSFLRLPDDPSYLADLLPGLVLLGLAAPFVFVSGSTLALQCTRPGDAGLASGVLGACQWLGGSLGVAAVSALLAAGDDSIAGIRAGFGLCAAVGLAAVVLAGVALHGRAPSCRLSAAT